MGRRRSGRLPQWQRRTVVVPRQERAPRPLTVVVLALTLVACGRAAGQTSSAAAASVRIPLQPGLEVVRVVSVDSGDHEGIFTIVSVDAHGVSLLGSAEVPVEDADADANPLAAMLGGARPASAAKSAPALKHVDVRRTVRREDLDRAHEYMQVFFEGMDDVKPGTTAIQL